MLRKLFLFIFLSLSFADTQALIEQYCNGQMPCYLCTDGSRIARCSYTCSPNETLIGDRCITQPVSQIVKKTAFVYQCTIWGECHIGRNGFSLFCTATREHPPGIFGSFCRAYNFYDRGFYLCRVIFHRGYTNCYASENTCPQGYIFRNNRCERNADLTCPLGNYRCYNPQTIPTQNTDTPEGADDKQNDGQITGNGCLGTIYIFNGHDYRCRPPGIQTGFSDCCKKTKRWFGLLSCSNREKLLAKLRAWGELNGKCHYVGSYCAEKWLGTCVQKKKTFCCYSSPLARIIIEAAHEQLNIPWGDPKHPNCRGLTPEEFQRLDFSRIDFSEWINYEIRQNIIPSINTSLSNAINNLQTTVQNTYRGQ